MNNIVAKLGLAGTSCVIVSEAVSLEPLYNALLSLAISVVSVLAVEGVTWLKNYIIRHTIKVEKDKE